MIISCVLLSKRRHSVKSLAPMKSNGSDGSLSPCQLSSGDLLQLNLAYESSLRHNPQKSQHSAKSLAPLKSNCSDGSLSPCELSSGDLLQLTLAYESSLRHNSIMQKGGCFFFFCINILKALKRLSWLACCTVRIRKLRPLNIIMWTLFWGSTHVEKCLWILSPL